MRSKSSVRLITAVASGALLLTMAPAFGLSQPAVLAAPMAEGDQEKVTERPDRVSAMVAARTQNSRVEDLSQRTSTTATYANPNGTWTVESFAGIVRSKADENEWVPIDTTVEDAGAAFEPNATPVDAEYSDGGDKTVGSVASADGSSVEVGWPTTLPAPVAEGDLLTYPDAVPGGDLVVQSRSDGFSYSVVLEEAPAADADPLEYRIPLRFDGVTAVEREDGSIILRDGGERVGVMTPPVMWDEANQGEDGERHPVAATVEGEGDARTLVLKPDMDFLRDPATTYPVTVDPQFSLSAAGDTYVDSSSSSDKSGSAELRVGSNNLGLTKTRTYLSFDLSSMSGQTGTADSAELRLTNFQTGACAGTAVRMSRTTSAFSIPTVTWASQPTTTADGSKTTTDGFGGGSCPGEGVMIWDATQVVNDARAAGSTLGLQIKGESETSVSGWRKFRSLENGDANKYPKLVVTFNKTPNTPTGLTVSPGNAGYATSTTPTFSAVVTDPDAGQTRGYFVVKSGSTTVWEGEGPSDDWATSGARVEVTVPSGILTNGNTYTVHAYSEDDLVKSTTAAASTFTVDTTAPTATLTATGYSNNTWSDPSSNTFTFQGSADTKTFETTFDGVPLTLTANGSAQYVWNSGPWPMTGGLTWGWHVWEAAAVDQAGNRGTATALNYGTGTPGFTLPLHNARSTGIFPVDISAPSGASSVTLQWKPSSGGSWATVTQATKDGAAWSGAVTTSGGRSTTGQLLWNATAEPHGSGTLEAPALISLNACFHYPSAADKCTSSYQHRVQLVPSAFGGNFPVTDLGPASVALFTGEASISGVDAADSKAGLSRSFSSYDAATVGSGVFGPGWSDAGILTASPDTKASVVDNRTKDGSIVIVDADSGAQTFVSDSGSTINYLPQVPTGDATKLTFTAGTGGDPDKLVLVRPVGAGAVTTTWTLKTPSGGGDPEWTADSATGPGGDPIVAITSANEHPVFIRESDPSISGTCNATTQTVGCRGLKITYTGTGSSTRVTSVDRVIGAAIQANVITKTLATYTYDGSGKLTSVCSAIPAAGKPALCTSYAYTTIAGRTLISEMTPAGLKKWRFDYDTSGRLTTVKREKPTGGDATWSVDYSLTPASSGLPDLTASTAAQWGQQTIPTKVFAAYQPYNGSADVSKAQLFYTTADGTTTNTASYGPTGWLVNTSWYDANGNVVRSLDGAGWARVQAAAVAERPAVSDQASSYMVYNTWGDADVVGTRVVDEYGPAHTATLKNGTVGLFRTHTHTMYDDDPNVDSALIANRPGSVGLGLAVKVTSSASDAARITDYDSIVTKYGYDPIVTGDGSGWTLGSPTKVSSQLGSGWSEAITRYDTSGRVIETRQPGGSADGTGAGNDAHSTVTTYYTASGSGDCGGQAEWDGLVCKVGPAAQPSGTSIPIVFIANYDGDLQQTEVQEISDATSTRTTETTFDNLGRLTNLTRETFGSAVTNETISTSQSYDDESGLLVETSSGGMTVSRSYDSWGRRTAYTDSFGSTSSSSYDDAGNLASFNDGTATYAYSFDGYNRLSSVDVGGGAGSYTYTFTTAGALDTVTYPNGVAASRSYDEVGRSVGLTYSQGSTALLSFSAAFAPAGQAVAQTSSASSRRYAYDDLGRLAKVEDGRSGGCTTRTYGFDASSNRTSFASFDPAAGGACQTTTATVTDTGAFDSAGRIANTGYSFDTLGRTLTTPQADAGPNAAGAVTATYHANDMVATLSQNVVEGGATIAKSMTYGLDPDGRIRSVVTNVAGVEASRLEYRYADSSDSPVAVRTSTDGGTSWTAVRNIVAPDLGMSATSAGGTVSIQLSNLHGDIVATMPGTSGASSINDYSEADEYGQRTTSSARFGWLGTARRSTDALGGLVLMGARLYNPSTGLFGSDDPIRGGNRTRYGYPEDPINDADLSGTTSCRAGSQEYGYYRSTIRSWVGVAVFSIKVNLSWCSTPGSNPRVMHVRAVYWVDAHTINEKDNLMGPTDSHRFPIPYSRVSAGPRMYLHFWFDGRSCVAAKFGVPFCPGGWNHYHFVLSLGAKGSLPAWREVYRSW